MTTLHYFHTEHSNFQIRKGFWGKYIYNTHYGILIPFRKAKRYIKAGLYMKRQVDPQRLGRVYTAGSGCLGFSVWLPSQGSRWGLKIGCNDFSKEDLGIISQNMKKYG